MQIDIDFEVFKALTALRENEVDSFNAVIRRALKLEHSDTQDENTKDELGAWSPAPGVKFPAGTEFRARLKGQNYYGKVNEGVLIYDDRSYKSPSAAAYAITGYNVNGWGFWECKIPGQENWRSIAFIRTNGM